MIASMNRENLAIKADNKILENYNEELKTIQTKFLKLLSSKDQYLNAYFMIAVIAPHKNEGGTEITNNLSLTFALHLTF